jgi:DNA invertase Pin-like site-specific DNA recombinase
MTLDMLSPLMQRIRDERDFDYIITYSTSRMNRNWKDNGAVLLELASLGVALVSATENVNADTAEGELLQGMHAVFNGFRSRQDGEDIQRKMTYKASKGGTVYRAPLGYLNVKKRVEDRLVSSVIIDEERAPLIRLAFELYATGRYSYKALQAKLTETGLRARPNGRYGERPISIYRLGTMLQTAITSAMLNGTALSTKASMNRSSAKSCSTGYSGSCRPNDGAAPENAPITTTSKACCGATAANGGSSSCGARTSAATFTSTTSAGAAKATWDATCPTSPWQNWQSGGCALCHGQIARRFLRAGYRHDGRCGSKQANHRPPAQGIN